MGTSTSTHEALEKTTSEKVEKGSERPRRMDRLRRSLRDSFRRRKDHVPESSKPHQWQADEAAVRAGTCSFHVKYLGCVEVFESRGMQVCEEALKVLRNSRRRPVKAILYVSGDGLRFVEDETKGLIVDQTIEKVSFCAPDRSHEKGFSYICRDGTTRRWMCHGFLALKESGERLSHAVGCAFAACLERKQKRDKECGVTMTFDPKNSTFTRLGSFRQTSITERLQDPQDIKQSDPQLNKNVQNPFAIERPHATPSMLQRQGSFRGFQQLNQTSPFKRQLSLRLNDLPSTLERQRSLSLEGSDFRAPNKAPVSPIPEASPVSDKADPVSAMCQQVSQGLSLLSSNDDPFLSQHGEQPTMTVDHQGVPTASIPAQHLTTNSSTPAVNHLGPVDQIKNKYHHSWVGRPMSGGSVTTDNIPLASIPMSTSRVSWGIVSVAPSSAMHTSATPVVVSSSDTVTTIVSTNLPHPEQWLGSVTSATSNGQPGMPPPPRRPPHLTHLRSQSLGSAEPYLSNQRSHVNSTHNSWGSANGQSVRDPFDAEWAAIAARNQSSTNPFTQNAVKAFEVQM